MNIHEYQAKELLAAYNVPILKNGVIQDLNDVESVANNLGGPVWVVKAQNPCWWTWPRRRCQACTVP